MFPMIFIHIPKTAGTSFRLGASQYFGLKHELRDYGKDVVATSPMINNLIHKRKDFETFRKKVSARNIKLIAGHFPSERYLPYFDKGTFVTFLRDPVQRVVSEYKHAVRINGLKDSLNVFCKRPGQINRQSKFVKKIGIENMAFVGLTEQYERSLKRINEIFDTDIPLLKKNLGKEKVDEKHSIRAKDADLIRSLNSADIELYASVTSRFEDTLCRQLAPKRKNCFAGKVGGVRKGKIVGWAVNRDREIPVEISIFINGEIVGHTLANRYRRDLRKAGIKRSGNGGILFDLKGMGVNDGDIIEFREKKSDQVVGKTVIDQTKLINGKKPVPQPTFGRSEQ